MATHTLRVALALAFSRPRPAIRMAAASDSFPKLADELPFLQSPELLADDIIYRGFGAQYKGRQAYAAAAAAWKRELPARLRDFVVSDKVALPADGRGYITSRYKVSFLAPVPLQVLPAQRARIEQANLTRTADGLVPVEAKIACTLRLDAMGRVAECSEYLTIDPFAVTATIAHFELCYHRSLAADGGGTSPLDAARAYWAALRELTRRELEEVKRLADSGDDELRAIAGGDLTDDEFERWFALFVARNFLIGGAIGAVAVAALRLAVGAVQQ
jgi:hypothetical protein